MSGSAVKYPPTIRSILSANDMSAIQAANSCPNTRLVPGGTHERPSPTWYSPVPWVGLLAHLPAVMSIAAVALFGNGSRWVGPIAASAAYSDRTIEDLCHGDDRHLPTNTWEANGKHLAGAYARRSMVSQAATSLPESCNSHLARASLLTLFR